MKVTMLGCGGSGGVPPVGAGWGALRPGRTRATAGAASSILVEADGATLLVDTSPDLREQLLDAGVSGSTP